MNTIKRLTENAAIVGPDFFQSADNRALKPLAFVAGPTSEKRILDAEQRLGLTFPDEYRVFVSTHGAMLTPGLELFGISPICPPDQLFFRDVENETSLFQKANGVGQSARYIAISSDGMETYFLLDSMSKLQTRIVAFGPGVDCVVVANSLDAFCENMLIDTYARFLNDASGHC